MRTIALALALAGCSAAAAPPPGGIELTVVNDRRQPVPGATISFACECGEAHPVAADGSFQSTVLYSKGGTDIPLDDGTKLQFTVSAESYTPQTHDVVIGKKALQMQITLEDDPTWHGGAGGGGGAK